MALRISTPAVTTEKVLVNAWNLAASVPVYVRADCNKVGPATKTVGWRVLANKASTILWYRSRTIANTGTITLADATRVDDGDTFFLNGVAITAEATPADATGNKWLSGTATTTIEAAALAACINSNVPGVIATSAAAVVTVRPSASNPAPTLLFQLAANGDGTQAADTAEIAWADNTLIGLVKDGAIAQVTGAINNTTAGTLYEQNAGGYPYCYIGYTDTSAAITALTIGASTGD